MHELRCERCGTAADLITRDTVCASCSGALYHHYGSAPLDDASVDGSMWRFHMRLPVRLQQAVTLGEGLTPLLPAKSRPGLHLKLELMNPTGSVKDRAMSVAVSKGAEVGARRTLIASTGSAGVSAAAYSVRANMACTVLVPNGTPTHRKELMAYFGARVFEVEDSFESLMEILEDFRSRPGWCDVSTYRAANPHQADGPKTIAYELFRQLGRAPDAIIVPVGGGGTLAGIHRGFIELRQLGILDRIPAMHGVQHAAFNVLEVALARGYRTLEELNTVNIDSSVAIQTVNLKHTIPPDSIEALNAIRSSRGSVETITDEQALAAIEELATTEGIFAEASSATAWVAAKRLISRRTTNDKEAVVVAVLTGSALRDLQALAFGRERIHRLSPQEARAFMDTP